MSDSDPQKQNQVQNRSEMLEEIDKLLSEADDELLDIVRTFLLVKAVLVDDRA